MSSNLEMYKNSIPKKGDIFLYKANNINEIFIDTFYKKMFNDKKIKNDFLIGRYLLFTYLGYGYAREYFSSEIFNIVMEDGIYDKYLLNYFSFYKKEILKDEKLFLEDYNRFKKYPLLIKTKEGFSEERLYKYNKYAKGLLDYTNEEINYLKQIIEEKSNEAKNNLISSMNEIDQKGLIYEKKDN